MSDTIADKIAELGYSLPDAPAPVGSYLNSVLTGNQLHISGGLPFNAEKKVVGQVPRDLSVEEAQEGARLIVLNRLAVAKEALGSLDRITKIVSISGFVNSSPDFYDHPAIINGASDLLVKIFGEAGKHSRIALGVSALPLNAAVEISMILEVTD